MFDILFEYTYVRFQQYGQSLVNTAAIYQISKSLVLTMMSHFLLGLHWNAGPRWSDEKLFSKSRCYLVINHGTKY